MRLQLRCHGDIDLSQPGMQVEIRSHIARCLRDYPNGGEGVITLAGVEHSFMYVVQNDVVDTVIGPPDYIEQVFNEGRQDMQEEQCLRCRVRTTTAYLPLTAMSVLSSHRGTRGSAGGSHASLVGSCGATVSDDSTVCRACTMTIISLAWRDWVE